MIIVLKQEAITEDVTRIEKTIEEKGLQVHVSKGENQTIMGLIGDTTKVDPESIEVDPAVEKVMHVSEPYKLANRAFHPEDSVIDVGGVKIGGGHLAVLSLIHIFKTISTDLITIKSNSLKHIIQTIKT